MEKEYVLNGLDCVNCANKLEKAVRAIDGVATANLNFMTSALKVETVSDYKGDITPVIKNTVHECEPDIRVTEKMNDGSGAYNSSHNDESQKKMLITLITGAVVFAANIVFSVIFELNIYVKTVVFLLSYFILGGDIVLRAVKNIAKLRVFDESFLMSIATIGAFAIGDYTEAVAVMLFYQIGEFAQNAAVNKSKKSITALMDIRPDYANLIENGEIKVVLPDTVKPGDIIVVKPGEKIPLDGIVTEGSGTLDTTALTGESAPRNVNISDEVLSGCINISGVLKIRVSRTFGESAASKIIDLVQNSGSKKARTEKFITVFAKYYTPAVVMLAVLISVIPPLLLGGVWADWINRGLIFLVISCPCALVISIPLGYFCGIGRASKKGILIKGGNYLDTVNKLGMIVFDKTGTLTKGTFEVTDIITSAGYTEDALLRLTAHAEIFSNHPIALSVQKKYGKEVDMGILSDYTEISGYGVSVKINGKKLLAGNGKLMKGIPYTEAKGTGTKIYIALDGKFAGSVIISDVIKPDGKDAVSRLKARGIETVMLTGDNMETARSIADKIGIDEIYAGLLPVNKVEKIEMLRERLKDGRKLAFIGDGINDAPVLASADIGIAMGGIGSDAAIEAADAVLMTDELSRISDMLGIAERTKMIVWQNIIFALGIKALFLLLGAFGVAEMWEAVFADIGVSVLAVLNSMRILYSKKF